MHAIVRIHLLNCEHRSIEVVLRGSGNPSDEHEIVAVTILDADDNRLFNLGEPRKQGAPTITARTI
jgi:hypothetical protein